MSTNGIARRAFRVSLALTVTAGTALVTMAGTAGAEVDTTEQVKDAAIAPAMVIAEQPLDVNSTKVQKKGTKVLEVNLCATGADEDCYNKKGASLKATQELIEENEPQTVIFNEGCFNQLEDLVETMKTTLPRNYIYGIIQPMQDANGKVIHCDKGGKAGLGVITSVPQKANKGFNYFPRQFATQGKGHDRGINLCVVAWGSHYACGTNLTKGSTATSKKQLAEMVGDVWPSIGSKNNLPMVGGGAFNLDKKAVAQVIEDEPYVAANAGSVFLLATDDRKLGEVHEFELKGSNDPAVLFEVANGYKK